MGDARDDPGDGRRADAEVFNRFAAIVRDRLSALADSQHPSGGGGALDRLYKSPEFDAEKRVLNELNGLGLRQGVLAAAGCFAFLRISPRMISNYLRRRAGVAPVGGGEGTSATAARNPFRRGSYQFDRAPTASGTAAGPERPGLLFRAVRFGLDTFVSLSIGAYASIAFVDRNEMMRKFAEIPLVQGRSLLSEELCADFAEEFRRTPPGVWDRGGDGDGGEGEYDFRRTVRGFVANCRRREVCESELREEQGLGRHEAVSVPAPGVPRVDVNLDDLLLDAGGSDEQDEGSNGGGGDYFDDYFGTDENDQVTK